MHQWTVLVGGTEGSEIREKCYEKGATNPRAVMSGLG